MKGDLHVHTRISDGSYNTRKILELAKQKGLTHIGITNHDTVVGIEEAIKLGNEIGVKVIPGIEISAYDFKRKRKVHILGYNFNLEAPNITKLCKPILIKRNRNSKVQMERLIYEGYDIDIKYINELSKESKVIYKQHIMDALIQKHYTDSIYSNLYRRLFKNNGICAMDIEYVDYKDAVLSIIEDGGKAVLAHPAQYDSYDIIEDLVSNGLWGIEVNHHCHSEEDRKRIIKIAKENNLVLTGGTDFHGKYNEKNVELGEFICPEETLKFF